MRWNLALLVLAVLLLPVTAASGAYPPAEAPRVAIGETTLAHWGGDDLVASDGVGSSGTVERGNASVLWFGADIDATRGKNQSLLVEVESADLGIANVTLTLILDSMVSNEWTYANVSFATNASTPAMAQYSFTATLQQATENGTVVLETVTGGGIITVTDATVAPAPPGGLPTSWLVGGAAVVLVAAGAGAVMARQRAQRRKMRGSTRSQALREVELEERARKRPEEAAVVQQEIRAQEKVKEKRRDLQILEAKRADVLKSIELLRKRHESGGLTKLQFDNMVAKRQADLARVEADIAAMEAEDARGSAAA